MIFLAAFSHFFDPKALKANLMTSANPPKAVLISFKASL